MHNTQRRLLEVTNSMKNNPFYVELYTKTIDRHILAETCGLNEEEKRYTIAARLASPSATAYSFRETRIGCEGPKDLETITFYTAIMPE